MNLKLQGFTQRKPTQPGVYFVATDGHLVMSSPQRLSEGWDVADVLYFAGSYHNAHENLERHAHWRISTLSGSSYAWRRGMWMKGPITPMKPPA